MSEFTTEAPVVEAVVFTGIAAEINTCIEKLEVARDIAVNLESGIDTKSGISKTAVALRTNLYSTRADIHSIYQDIPAVRETLVAGLGDVQAAKTKEALIKSIEAAQAKLAAL